MEWVVEKLFGQKKVRKKLHYRVRFYDYIANEDMIDLANNITQKFILFYSDLQKKMANKEKVKIRVKN